MSEQIPFCMIFEQLNVGMEGCFRWMNCKSLANDSCRAFLIWEEGTFVFVWDGEMEKLF